MTWRTSLALASVTLTAASVGCGEHPRTGKARGLSTASAATSAAITSAAPFADVVRGRARFADAALDAETGQVVDVTAAPIAGAVVRVLDAATGAEVAAGVTDAQGGFALPVPPDAPQVVVRVEARTAAARPRVGVYPLGALDPWALESGPVAPGVELDLAAQEAGAAPFNILEATRRGVALAQALEPGAELPDLRLLWTPGVEGTFYDPASGALQVSGDPQDDDGTDDAVVLHEVGHYVQRALIGDPSPGGVHLACPAPVAQLLDRRLAFSEGWASAFSAFVRGDPRLVELGVGAVMDLEEPCAQVTGPGAEQMVGALLWDLVDGGQELASTDAETVTIPLSTLWRALRSLSRVPHFEVGALARALVEEERALTQAEWNAAFGPLGLALPLPEWTTPLRVGGCASGKVDASAPQDALARARAFHTLEVTEAGLLTVTLQSNPSAGALWLAVWAPFPHGANAAVLASVPATPLAVPVEPGTYLVQVRAQGDGLGRPNACYSLRAALQPGRGEPPTVASSR